jgi:hypothetical protein
MNQQPPVFKDYHPSTKSGPNGHALVTSINDAFAWESNPRALKLKGSLITMAQDESLGWATELIANSIDLTM